MKIEIQKACMDDESLYIKLRENFHRFNYNNRPLEERNYNFNERQQKVINDAKQNLKDSIENDNILILIAKANNTVAGYALAYILEGNYGLLDHLFVEEKMRGLSYR